MIQGVLPKRVRLNAYERANGAVFCAQVPGKTTHQTHAIRKKSGAESKVLLDIRHAVERNQVLLSSHR